MVPAPPLMMFCVPQNKTIEGNGAFLEPEDASYASSSKAAAIIFFFCVVKFLL